MANKWLKQLNQRIMKTTKVYTTQARLTGAKRPPVWIPWDMLGKPIERIKVGLLPARQNTFCTRLYYWQKQAGVAEGSLSQMKVQRSTTHHRRNKFLNKSPLTDKTTWLVNGTNDERMVNGAINVKRPGKNGIKWMNGRARR